MAAAPSPARTRPRSIAPPPTPRATSPRTSSPPISPTAAPSSSPMPSASSQAAVDLRRSPRHRPRRRGAAREGAGRGHGPVAARHPPAPRPQPADLCPHLRLRPFRPRAGGRRRLLVGAHRSRRGAPRRRRLSRPGDGVAVTERRDSLYGRRKGKPLSPRRAALMATRFPTLAIDTAEPPPADLADAVPARAGARSPRDRLRRRRASDRRGARANRTPASSASSRSSTAWRRRSPRSSTAARATSASSAATRRCCSTGCRRPRSTRSISSIPTRGRRSATGSAASSATENLDRLARVLKPGGVFRFASDIPSYVEWTLARILRRERLRVDRRARRRLATPFPDWPGTRYEAKALARRAHADLSHVPARVNSVHQRAPVAYTRPRQVVYWRAHDLPESQIRLQGARPSRRAAERRFRPDRGDRRRPPASRGSSSSTSCST